MGTKQRNTPADGRGADAQVSTVVSGDEVGGTRGEVDARHHVELLRAVNNSLGEGVYALDMEGRLTLMNPAAERILGWTEAELLGRKMHEAIHYQRADGTRVTYEECPLLSVIRSSSVYRNEDDAYTRKDGTVISVAVTSSPIVMDEMVVGAAVAFRDITERKRADEELDRRARQAALGADVGVALAQGGESLRYVLQRCAEAVVRHLGAAFARIWTLNREEDVLELQASAGMYTHTNGPHGRVPVGKFKIGLIAEERKPHLTNSVVGDPRVGDQEWARREGMVSFAGYPLVVEDRLVGVMAMFSREELSRDTLDALASVANTIAQGIERRRADEALAALMREREQALEEISTPVVPVLEGVLVLPLIGSLDSVRTERATRAALTEVTRQGARVCIIDITGARMVDSHAVANLTSLVQALKLVGADAFITGVGSQVAQTLVGLGLDMRGLRTYRTLAQALAALVGARR
jgi:PAS domain S-box-containing protein